MGYSSEDTTAKMAALSSDDSVRMLLPPSAKVGYRVEFKRLSFILTVRTRCGINAILIVQNLTMHVGIDKNVQDNYTMHVSRSILGNVGRMNTDISTTIT